MSEKVPVRRRRRPPLDEREQSTPSPNLFINRELSQLEFLGRVLEQAKSPDVPLLERLRFLTISSSVLDEFFEIRVGGLREQLALGLARPGPDGLGPPDALARIRERALGIVEEQYRVLNDVLLPALEKEGIIIYRRDAWSAEIRLWAQDYFAREVLPVVTPLGLDPAHPFPRILNKSLNFIVSVDGADAFGRRSRTAVVQAPRLLPRLLPLPPGLCAAPRGFVLLSSVIHHFVGDLFPGMRILACDQFRVTRNSDLWVDEEEVDDLMLALKGELTQRNFGSTVRLEVSHSCSPEQAKFLLDQFELGADALYRVNGPVNLSRLEAIHGLVDRADLKYAPFVPGLPRKLIGSGSPFDVLRGRDILLHHPYQSFGPVIDFLRAAARDPDVLAIKQTLYRTGLDSPMGEALLEAARAGKEVTAVVELRARFDEAANIALATRLQEAGAKVVYGIVGYKAHAKMLLVVRRESGGLRRYTHLGTGNYHTGTARTYTDFSLMTADTQLGEDVHELFQQLTGLGTVGRLSKLVQTPFGLEARLKELIGVEAAEARAGRPSGIIAKMNSLIDPGIIRALYDASQAGVSIDLIVRGVCCLRPGVAGVSENIRVRSIVGRFLEHHRVFYFHAHGLGTTLLSSADWMPRNFFRRVEAAFPVEGKNRERAVEEALTMSLEDNVEAWRMRSDGGYDRATPGTEAARSVQKRLLEKLAKTS